MSPSPSRPDAGIVLRNVSFQHPGHTILARANLDLPAGSTCVVTGPNGSGKSTLLYLCAALLDADSGSISIGGARARADRASEYVRRGIRRGFLFQEGGLLSNMNSISNVALPLRYHADLLGLSDAQIHERTRSALDRVRLGDADRYALPAYLSYGERKRVALARALAIEPNFYFFDEPLVGLDAETEHLVEAIVMECRKTPGITTLVATSSATLAERLGGDRYLLVDGKLGKLD